jgi:HTH-type transcriptional regulator, sugar sensing transcriptional regulator
MNVEIAMTTVELLQQLGLNKYEAEAYYTLLSRGSLTGYEVGKYSQVPLSRSYEILERLTEKGLALVQPGDPPRYSAQEPQQFLAHVRSTMETTLGALTESIAALARIDNSGEFWVVRGHQHILERVQNMIRQASTSIALATPAHYQAELAHTLMAAQERGCTIYQYTSMEQGMHRADTLLVLCDEQEALAGTITAATASSQAVISSNVALLTALNGYFAHQRLIGIATPLPALPPVPAPHDDWLAWEERKQRSLWKAISKHRVA